MRIVDPEVYLIARPQVDAFEVRRFLDSIGANDAAVAARVLDETGGDTLVEIGGRECYRSWEPRLNPNVQRIRQDQAEYLGNVLASGHGSVVEHPHYTFIFHNVSRVFTHELVRHRHENISQESMRFVRLTDIPFWFPRWVYEDDGGSPELFQRCYEVLELLEKHQAWMAEHFGLDDPGVSFDEKKHKTSFMRRFAPDGVATGMVWTANVRGLRHIITMRTAPSAEEEIRLVFDRVAQLMKLECPALLQDFVRSEDGVWTPKHRKV